jgi:formate dehydrogenase
MLASKPPSPSVVAFASPQDMALKIRQKSQLKGRQVDEVSLAEVRVLLPLDDSTLKQRPDLLIEHLHKINDT